jgi:hypothetical protein
MFCTNCGIQLADGIKFCTQCGRATKNATQPAPESPPQQPIYIQPEVVVHHTAQKGQDVTAGFGKGFGETMGKITGRLVSAVVMIIVSLVILYAVLSCLLE